MVDAVITVDERNGAPAGVEENTITNVNMGSTDAPNLVAATYPIIASDSVHAFEKWLKIAVAINDANKIDNLQVWQSVALDAAAELLTNARTSAYGGAETYAQPVTSTSTVATQTMPLTDPGAANLGIAGSLTGDLQITGQSDYLVLQYQPGAAHAPGDISTLTYHFQYDEQ